ncbi:hypothetical protein GWI33_011822 [Rhynchophorus ferrugineus]|uniref:Uncharacterized protein n=1 Tax=Rhynchophorus ferrugineus TaxID=354439 RepID=A0A834IJR1_RHYFE|nr:hypothetical protein GWI33_011822 [Rhynchophorus ferrugineus]
MVVDLFGFVGGDGGGGMVTVESVVASLQKELRSPDSHNIKSSQCATGGSYSSDPNNAPSAICDGPALAYCDKRSFQIHQSLIDWQFLFVFVQQTTATVDSITLCSTMFEFRAFCFRLWLDGEC